VSHGLGRLPAYGIGEATVDRNRGSAAALAQGPGDRGIGQTAEGHFPANVAEDDIAVLEPRGSVGTEEQFEPFVVRHRRSIPREVACSQARCQASAAARPSAWIRFSPLAPVKLGGDARVARTLVRLEDHRPRRLDARQADAELV
jgi:hypothetical protein